MRSKENNDDAEQRNDEKECGRREYVPGATKHDSSTSKDTQQHKSSKSNIQTIINIHIIVCATMTKSCYQYPHANCLWNCYWNR